MTWEPENKNPWWSYTILIVFVACLVGRLFVPNLFTLGRNLTLPMLSVASGWYNASKSRPNQAG